MIVFWVVAGLMAFWVIAGVLAWSGATLLYETERKRELRDWRRELKRARDSGRHAKRENGRSPVEAEGCQSGGEAASPNPSPSNPGE